MKKRKILIVFILLFISEIAFTQGYSIAVKIKGVENKQIILGHHKNDNLLPDDTIKTNSNGYGVFKGNKKLQQGMYFIFLPNQTYFDILIGNDQNFYIQNDTSDIYNNLKVKNSDELYAFVNYHNFLMSQNKKMTKLQAHYKATTDSTKQKEINEQIKAISATYQKHYDDIVIKHPNWFFTTFLKATHEITIPDNIQGQVNKYYYYKNHFFDNFPLSDKRLLFTNLYNNKIDYYLDKIVAPDPDTLIAATDFLLAQTKNDKDLYQNMLIHLFNKYARSNLMTAENLYVHLGEIYIQKAVWSTDSFKNELKTKIIRKKNCLIGNKAPDLHMVFLPDNYEQINNLKDPLAVMKEKGLVIETDKTRKFKEKVPELSNLIAEYLSFFNKDFKLYNLKSKYTILWFMSPDCSHCKHDTPLFFNKLKSDLKDVDVNVWSIFMETNTDNWNKFSNSITDWFDFISKNKMIDSKWHNVWNPFDNYRFKYDISSSPVIYLLDKDKKIIAKRIGYEQVIEIIKEIEKEEKKK